MDPSSAYPHDDQQYHTQRQPSGQLDPTQTRDESPAPEPVAQPILPEVAPSDFGDLFSIIGTPPSEETAKVSKRASNVLKLAEENDKLNEQLKAMTERLEAAERRRAELAKKAQQQRTREE
ncbi:hypothetical protein BD626DRAFT_508048 [Schizophyllum amplum]|uniref:Uncharacterized protein n=1 Tax=Schizophyllum amplum TaxID=97359 RepID=A0A550C3H6_9AGAR|nr:hypothetical protein BD626DRAFT_508048 [Auriculariopsis ampla]